MAELLIREVERLASGSAGPQHPGGPGSSRTGGSGAPGGITHDREGYALAAGLALGMVTLGTGRQAPGLADLKLEERLRCVLSRGRKGRGKKREVGGMFGVWQTRAGWEARCVLGMAGLKLEDRLRYVSFTDHR